jgi:hypothetical protein
MFKRVLFGMMIIALALTLSAPVLNVQAVVTTATVQVVVGAVLSTNVDVYIDSVITAESGANATKPLNQSGFIVVQAGSHTISLTQTGTSTPASAPYSSAYTGTFAAGTDTTLVLYPDGSWAAILDTGTPPASGNVSVRVFNISPNNATVDVSINTIPAATSITGTAYKSASSYVSIPVGTYTITEPASTKSTTKNLLGSHVYSIFVFGDTTSGVTKVLAAAQFDFSMHYYLPMMSK